jgi:hypothetical protein
MPVQQGGFMRRLAACLLALVITYGVYAQSTPPGVTMWLYRPAADNAGVPLTLFLDGRKLTNLGAGQFFGIQVPSGLHAFNWTAQAGARQVVIPIGADPQAYLEVNFRSGSPFLIINPLTADKAIIAMSGLRPVDENGVFDPGVIIPAQAIQGAAKTSAPAAAQESKPAGVPQQQKISAPPPAPVSPPPSQRIAQNDSQATKPEVSGFHFQTEQFVYIVCLDSIVGDRSLTKNNLEIEKNVKEQFWDRKKFRVSNTLNGADFVFFVMPDPNSQSANQIALALRPQDYLDYKSDLVELRNHAVYRGALGSGAVFARPTSVSKELVEQFHKDVLPKK